MDQKATELVIELAKQAINLAKEASGDWREVYVRFSAPSDSERGWKGSLVDPAGVQIFDVLQHKERGKQIMQLGIFLRDAMARNGNKFVVCLVRANSDYQYQIDFEWTDGTKWNLSKLRGGSGLPEGLEVLPPLA